MVAVGLTRRDLGVTSPLLYVSRAGSNVFFDGSFGSHLRLQWLFFPFFLSFFSYYFLVCKNGSISGVFIPFSSARFCFQFTNFDAW